MFQSEVGVKHDLLQAWILITKTFFTVEIVHRFVFPCGRNQTKPKQTILPATAASPFQFFISGENFDKVMFPMTGKLFPKHVCESSWMALKKCQVGLC